MASSSDAWKSISFSTLAIVLSLPLGIIVWIISLLAGISPPMNYTVNGYNLSFFSPLILSGVFIGIINTSAFYRMKFDFKILNFNHNIIFGSLLNSISFVFLLSGNLGILLSAFIKAVNSITILLWIGFMGLFVIFFVIGNIFIGINFYNLGKLNNNLTLKKIGLLLSLVVSSYVGYVLLYLATKPKRQQVNQTTYPYYGNFEKTVKLENEQTRVTSKNSNTTRYVRLYSEKTVKLDNDSETIKIHGSNIIPSTNPDSSSLAHTSKNMSSSTKQQTGNSNNVSPNIISNNTRDLNNKQLNFSPNNGENYEKNDYGVLKGDGSLYVNLHVNEKCYIVSIKFSTLPYSPLLVQPQILNQGYNHVYIKFDKIITHGLVKEKIYKLYISLRTDDKYLPDKEVNVVFQP